MLKIEVAHSGSCKEPCEGMEGIGLFQAFNTRATNTGIIQIITPGLLTQV